MSMNGLRILTIGTLNIDRVWRVPTLPRPGQTVLANDARRDFGGKGANQAVSAARQGASVFMVGAVGSDAEGQDYLAYLGREGVDVSHVLVTTERETGTAHVYVDPKGENAIVVHAGANGYVTPALVQRALADLPSPDMLLVQLECPVAAAVEALRMAAQRQCRTVLNAAPADPAFPWGDVPIAVLVVNEHECAEALGCLPDEVLALSAPARVDLLRRYAVRDLVITRGAAPTLHVAAAGCLSVPTFKVKPVDTVGAGDTFVGVLATKLAGKASWRDAIWAANVAAALSTLMIGAQSGMPNLSQLAAALHSPEMA